MKKLFLFIIVLFYCNNVYAIEGHISFAYMGNSSIKVNNENINFTTKINLNHKPKINEKIKFYTEVETFMSNFDLRGFSPTFIIFDSGVSYNIFNDIYIKINHSCTHDIGTNDRSQGYDGFEIGWDF